jgi:hypothetical protein
LKARLVGTGAKLCRRARFTWKKPLRSFSIRVGKLSLSGRVRH